MVFEIAQKYKDSLKDYDFLASLSTRKSWDNLEDHVKIQIIKNGEQYINYQYSTLPATLFMSFVRTGNRVNYEDNYFSRRKALNSLVLAECMEEKGRFLDDIINGIFVICEETAWQLPPHNSYVRDTPNHILPDCTAPVLDLFACETGAELSMIRYLLKDSLDKISPFIIKRIEQELKHRIITPYLKKHFWWIGNEDEPMNNWTIWCTQNILLTVFTNNQSEDIKLQTFLKASKSIDYFLKEYGEDGCCDEGAQYYRHAGLCLFNSLEILNAITENYFASLYQNQKIKSMASYIENVHVDDEYYINFADCSPTAGGAGVREFLFGKRTHNNSLMNFAAKDFTKNKDPFLTKEINLFYRIQSIFHHQEIQNFHITEPVIHNDFYYPSVGLFVARDEHYCLAAKAGDNNDSHNHNDTGSFTIYKEGKPFFIDIGVESYTKKTFSPERYDIWTMQSDYHNLPTINGYMQKDGVQYRATNVHPSFDPSISSISMDIECAYPESGLLQQYTRTITFVKGKHIIITDNMVPLNGNVDVILNLITYDKPVYHDNIMKIGSLGIAQLIGSVLAIEIEEIEITDPRLQITWKHDIYRTRITLGENQLSLIIS